jgi:hypothetical protein
LQKNSIVEKEKSCVGKIPQKVEKLLITAMLTSGFRILKRFFTIQEA